MASYQYSYVIKNLYKAYVGGRQIFNNLTLSFLPGAKIGVLGINGAGKSTLLKIMAGLDTNYTGEAWAAEGLEVGYLPQEPFLNDHKNVLENILSGVQKVKDLLDEFDAISQRFAEDLSEEEMNEVIEIQGNLQEKIDLHNGWDLQRQIEIAMDALRCPRGEQSVVNLSGGEKRRVALCRLLISAPGILLLDEPTNHLDAESVAWLERYLKGYKGTVVLITHDRYFLDNITEWILEIDRGEGYPYEGNYSSWLEEKEKRLKREESEEKARQKVIHSELEWIRQSPKARRSKSKSRVQAFDELVQQSLGQTLSQAQIVIPAAQRLGTKVLHVQGLSKGMEDKLLFENVSFHMPPGAIVGVIGPNGAGKTTLFRILSKQLLPDAGSVEYGDTVQMAYVDQSRDVLDNEKTIWEVISDGLDEIELGKYKIQSRAYVGRFNFKGADQQKKISALSGGERNRVHLARILKLGANVLFLDEPTNDLDLDTLRALEEALLNYAGCVFVTSHDRWFLDRIATHILAFEGNSQVVWFEGNYQEYEMDYKNRFSREQPCRIQYKPLKR